MIQELKAILDELKLVPLSPSKYFVKQRYSELMARLDKVIKEIEQ